MSSCPSPSLLFSIHIHNPLPMQVLKKHKKDFDRSAPLWTVTTPAAGCAYHPSCGSYMKFMCCHCCVSFTDWRVTGQGIRWRKNRAAIDICGQSELLVCLFIVLFIIFISNDICG